MYREFHLVFFVLRRGDKDCFRVREKTWRQQIFSLSFSRKVSCFTKETRAYQAMRVSRRSLIKVLDLRFCHL